MNRISAIIAAVALLAGMATPALSAPDLPSSAARSAAPVEGDGVFRPYGAPGGLMDEFATLAHDHPDITKLVTIGETVNGDDIVALKVSSQARLVEDGDRPATLFLAAQHAREWITPEMVRRFAQHVLDGYGSDPTLTDLVDSTELWFVPVANPDGYDYTFTPGNRMWRKNLRDNDGDGLITGADGVDLNRNYPTRWGYDDEGSSPDAGSDNYRGSAPASEPETQAVDSLMARVGFEFVINYHSASEDVFYGTAWQGSTPTPDDAVYDALAGGDAVPGYRHGLTGDLYIANGVTDEHAHVAYGSLSFLVEMSTCAAAASSDSTDDWEPAGCSNPLAFPDDEALIEAEFRRNLPFALAVARSAPDPDDPVTVSGRETPEFVVDAFDMSYGVDQPVAVVARRDQDDRRLEFSVNGGPVRHVAVSEWEGGERYGDERDRYYAEFRGEITGTRPGDSVEVWFTARRDGRAVTSEHFTYSVSTEIGATALVVANEDYLGVNPEYPAGTDGPKYVDEYAAALDANGISHATWDVDRQGVPHPLGVLAHFGVVVWETGDDRLPQDAEDALTDTFLLGPVPDIAVAERQYELTIAMRDYLNEGGKLLQAGENAQYFGLLGRSLGGVYAGLAGAPDQDCVVSADFLADCLLLSDDFAQYYLGANHRAPVVDPVGIDGAGPLDGLTADIGGAALADNPLDEAGGFSLTSDVLPAADHPQFAGEAAGTYHGESSVNPFGPVEGSRYAGALRGPASYRRIGRTIDLADVAASDVPTLQMQLSYSTLQTFHGVIVEAAPAGTDDWTTLPDLEGRTVPLPPSTCADGSLLRLHPFLSHYLSGGNPCEPTGTTGSWNMFTGESNGWVEAAFDLSAYAGGPVAIKVSYVTDIVDLGVGGGIGVFVDDTRLVVGGAVVESDGFEQDGGAWAVEDPPVGSPPVEGDFVVAGELIALSSAVTTEDTALLGFGLESLATPTERADVLGRLIEPLVGESRSTG
ncbi:M14 family metallopeptidase [Desertimonas flava]|uniref:M14 family metallopeptidase n=1 Tax=Desertimonas flava TaxID=2064846 RepID=UPI000E351DFE|nr:M14 family metallopeptidase [Desertimonas flava]